MTSLSAGDRAFEPHATRVGRLLMETSPLDTYLEDHQAGAAAGAKLAARIAESNARSEHAEDLRAFADEVRSDEATLNRLRVRLGMGHGGTAKKIIAVAIEGLSRLKLSDSSRPLTRVLEAEAMISGVIAKRCLWVALRSAVEANRALADEVGDFDFEELTRSADEQVEVLRSLHHSAAAAAFGHTAESP